MKKKNNIINKSNIENKHPISREQFEKLLMEHVDSIYNAALRLSQTPSDAEDLVQETYYRAFRFFSQFKQTSSSSFKSWLFKILRNTYINSYRKQRKKPDTIDYKNIDFVSDVVVDESFISYIRKTEKLDIKSAFDDEVTAALENLGDDYKLCIILKDVEGFSYKEISEITGDPLGTVLTRVHRARKILHLRLLDYAQKKGYGKKRKKKK